MADAKESLSRIKEDTGWLEQVTEAALEPERDLILRANFPNAQDRRIRPCDTN